MRTTNKKEFKLDDTYSIQGSAGNLLLIEKVESMIWNKEKTEKIPVVNDKKYYYGTVYQCLQGYLRKTVDKAETLKDVRKLTIRVLSILEEAETDIKKMFRTEVHVSK